MISLAGCASYAPQPLDPETDVENIQTKSLEDITVSVGILTDDQAQRFFGVDFKAHELQAMWIRVRNESSRTFWLLRNAVDPDFYSADEAALILRGDIPGRDFEILRQHLRDESILLRHPPDSVSEGYLILPRVEGGRYADIRLASDAYESATRPSGDEMREFRFGFAVRLPDGNFDYERLDTAHTYGDMQLPDLDAATLRERLEALPCCAMDASGENFGDPLNVVIVGEAPDVLTSLTRSGWSFTHRIDFSSVQRMLGAAIDGDAYPIAPVSSLYVFDRKQDFALQRARSTLAQRNHMRFWLAPFTHLGRQVWVGQVSRDIGIKVTPKSPTLTTHIIDPEVDLTREYLLHSLLSEGFVGRFGFVEGSRRASREDPAFNLTDDPFFSDGMRLVIILSSDPIAYEHVRSLRWEQSAEPVSEGQSEAAKHSVQSTEVRAGTPQE
jgi:hypothetical protein